MKDIGKIVGIYFYISGILGIILMIINLRITGNINIPLSSLVSFVAGYFLYNHNMKARKTVIVLSGIMMLLQFSIFIYLTIQGIPEGADIRLGGAAGIEITELINGKYIPTLVAVSIIIPGIPFFLLRTKKAKEEFKG